MEGPGKRRTIYFVWNYIEWGGAQIYFLAVMKAAKADWDIIVVLPRNSLPDILRFIDEIGVRYEFIDTSLDPAPAATIGRKLQRQWRRIHAEITTFRHLLRYNLRESILHIEAAPWQNWLLLTLLAIRGANIFVTLHNFLPKSAWWRESIWKARMQFVSRLPRFHIFASNQDTKNRLKGWVAPAFWDRIKVTYTSVNPDEIKTASRMPFDREEVCRTHGIQESKLIVLCVGQFIDRKGRWVFLDAAQKVLEKTSDIVFVWLTPKMPDTEDQRRIDGYNLNENFRLVLSETVGKDRIDVLRFFRVADIFALPSFVEGLPIALLEAMALKRPSISTNIYGIPEAIRHNETGILIEAGDSTGLAKAILLLQNDSGLRDRLSENGSRFVLEHFDERAAARIILTAYKESFSDGH